MFQWLQREGAVPEDDMRRTFNLGIGMALIVTKAKAEAVAAKLRGAGETVFTIGEVKRA